jgi:hypothetical protein
MTGSIGRRCRNDTRATRAIKPAPSLDYTDTDLAASRRSGKKSGE